MDSRIRRAFATGAGLSLGLALSAAAGAQTQPNTQGTQQSQAADQNGGSAQQTLQMVQARAQLDKTLDAKKAKQGDQVTAKLEQPVQIPDAQAFPKDTELEGHVDQVQPSEHKSDSTVTVTFDKARLKDGKEVPIKATVLAVAEPAYMQQQAGGSAPAASPAMMPSAGGGAPAGGAMGGGAGSGAAVPATPEPMNVPEASQGPSRTTQSHGGVRDVMLKSDIHEQTSATFSSKGKNVHVPDGTQMQFALTIIPPGVRVQ
jgi:hypothetical protein